MINASGSKFTVMIIFIETNINFTQQYKRRIKNSKMFVRSTASSYINESVLKDQFTYLQYMKKITHSLQLQSSSYQAKPVNFKETDTEYHIIPGCYAKSFSHLTLLSCNYSSAFQKNIALTNRLKFLILEQKRQHKGA